jgi:tungstate transport system ATP-binding protein
MKRLRIAHLTNRPALKLSGGEAQRTSLARAMVLNPEVLFLDEPFAALDAPTRQSQLKEFQQVIAESGVTAVFATHDRGEAVALGDRVAVLMNGRVAQVGTTEAVFAYPDRVEVARFVGVETLIPGRVSHGGEGASRVDCGKFTIDTDASCEVGEEVHVAVRSEEIDLIDAHVAETVGTSNLILGHVTRLVPTETHYRVELDCGPLVVAIVSRVKLRELALQVGSRVFATFPSSVTHLIKRNG